MAVQVSYSHLRDRAINDVFFRHVADFTYDWESWHDPDGNLVWVNRSVQRMTGFSVDQCWQMPDYPLPIVAPRDRPRMEQMLRDAIAKQSFNDLEFEIVTRDGQPRALAVSWQPIFDDNGTHLGFRTSVRDITDRQALKQQLHVYTEHLEQVVQQRTTQIAELEKHRRQMEKMAALGELAAGVAHEVNNPLAGIRNAFALFRSDLPESHEHYGLLELVDKEIERISRIIHQMYQLYCISPQVADEIRLQKVISDVICLLEPVANRYGVRVEIVSSDCTALVKLPEGELKQVLLNVLRNAIQASLPGSQVTVDYQTDATSLVMRVIDTGTGITADALPHIFDPFFSTKSQVKEGMGLGLSVTRSLVESLSGTIDVQTQVGSGTTFTIRLPRYIT
jgi:two-component system sporulation sensor kinase C